MDLFGNLPHFDAAFGFFEPDDGVVFALVFEESDLVMALCRAGFQLQFLFHPNHLPRWNGAFLWFWGWLMFKHRVLELNSLQLHILKV